MDDVALRYLLLGLRLGRHLPGFIDSYTGPPELAEAVGGEPLTPAAELHVEAMQLAGLAAELPAGTAALRHRREWLIAQVAAIGALARQAGGEEIGFVDLVEELYDIEVEAEPDSTFATARRMIDSVLPGSARLRDRLAAHEASSHLPPEQAIAAISELAGRLRTRTRAQLWLPDRESIRFEGVREAPFDADGRYQGFGRSVVRVNLDHPLSFATIVDLAAHDGYPGHHAEAAVKDAVLVAAGHSELSLIVASTPQTLVSEGMGALAREVVMSDPELGTELQRFARAAGQRLDIEVELVIQRARRLMLPALGNAALAMHRDGEPMAQVRGYLADVALVSDERLDGTLTSLADAARRTDPFAHIAGRRLVAEWLELHGQTHGYARLLSEQLTPGTLRSELLGGG
jgi:hypothetical protein